jgi:hypothetical protein
MSFSDVFKVSLTNALYSWLSTYPRRKIRAVIRAYLFQLFSTNCMWPVRCTCHAVVAIAVSALVPQWYIQGIALSVFLQMFTIYMLWIGQFHWHNYTLMKSKTQVDYERVYRKLLELRPSLTLTMHPDRFRNSDYERTVYCASECHDTRLSVSSWAQSLWRRVQNVGLVNLCRGTTRT